MSEEREVIRLLDGRRHGRGLDSGLVLQVLRREIAAFRAPTEHHAVWWNATAWCGAAEWKDSVRTRLLDLDRCLRTQHPAGPDWTLISRRDVFDRRTAGEIDLFLAAMAWGFGDRGYGWKRTATIIRDAGDEADLAAAVGAIRDAYQHGGASGAWTAWSRGGSAKLAGLDTAFASKLAYFACADAAGCGPLIADLNTAWAVWGLADISNSRSHADSYAAYVDWAHDRAGDLGCRPDDVERALFVLGPDVRQIWNRLEP